MLTILGMEHDPIFTLENPLRETSHDSRIPVGVYKCQPFYSFKFGDTYEVTNVPGRTAILFHWGNTERDTLGCILLGLSCGVLKSEPAVRESRAGFKKFVELIGKQDFTLYIVGGDLDGKEI